MRNTEKYKKRENYHRYAAYSSDKYCRYGIADLVFNYAEYSENQAENTREKQSAQSKK